MKKQATIKKAFIEAYITSRCNVAKSCKAVGISRTTFYNWCSEDKEFDKAVSDAFEETLDLVEGELLRQIVRGNVTATIFFLKTKGKSRGYVEKDAEKSQNSEFEQLLDRIQKEQGNV